MEVSTTTPIDAAPGESSSFVSAPVQSNPLTSRGRIPSLDGLRAISITLVVLAHVFEQIARPRPGTQYTGIKAAISLVANGGLGVAVFFVISGFLITRLLIREFNKTGTISIKQFYIRRTFRIWPAFFAYIGAVILLRALHVIQAPNRDIISAATFTYNYFGGYYGGKFDIPRYNWWLFHTWSLSVEEQFYLFWPLVLLLAGRRHAIFAAVAILILVPLVRMGEGLWLAPENLFRFNMWRMGHTRMDVLMFGCFAALLADNHYFLRVIRFLSHLRLEWIVIPYLLTGDALWKHVNPHLNDAIRLSIGSACITFLVVSAVMFHDGWFGRFLNCKPMIHLGLISYSLYLWQQLFTAEVNTSWTGMFPLNILCALIMAELSRRLIENPFLNWRGKWARHEAAQSPMPVLAPATANVS